MCSETSSASRRPTSEPWSKTESSRGRSLTPPDRQRGLAHIDPAPWRFRAFEAVTLTHGHVDVQLTNQPRWPYIRGAVRASDTLELLRVACHLRVGLLGCHVAPGLNTFR